MKVGKGLKSKVKNFHTPLAKSAPGANMGTGIRNPVGTDHSTLTGGPLSKKKLSTPPKKLA
jgi:hypothetical protein